MGKGAMGLFGANMADFQVGLALDAAANKAGGAARRLNRRVAARLNRDLHAVDAPPARWRLSQHGRAS